MTGVEVVMNGCPGADRLQEVLDGRAAGGEAAAILAHAKACPSCAPLLREHRSLKEILASARAVPASRCPSPEQLSAIAAGGLRGPGREEVVAHLADCRSCREDLVEARSLLRERGRTEPPRAGFRARLHGLMPRRSRELAWIGAAAAGAFVAVLALAFLGGREEEAPVAAPPRPAPMVAKEPVAPEAPEPDPPAPAPEKPAPVPEEPRKPVLPAVEPPVRKLPPAAPEAKPAPPPALEVKPPPLPSRPEPTRERPRIAGSVTAIAGALSTRAEGDASWQSTRAAQSREFAGAVDVRAELNPVKFRLGPHTLLLQRRTEISVALGEGATRVRLSKGEAVFDVALGTGAFTVQTANAAVTVAGTRFLVAGDADETEVAVQRGAIDLAAAGASVRLAASERSVAPAGKPPSAPARADLSKRLQWTRALEETIAIEAELMGLQKGMAVLSDPAASGGRGIGVKGALAAGAEASAEARVQVKQAVPYGVWVRLHWNHGVAPSFSLQVDDHPMWDGRHVAAKPAWQWVKAGTYELPLGGFRLRLADAQGGVRVDRILVTSDPEHVPE